MYFLVIYILKEFLAVKMRSLGLTYFAKPQSLLVMLLTSCLKYRICALYNLELLIIEL